MLTDRKPAGLILSAGFSSRMKDFKPLMPIGNSCPLGILTESMKIAGITDIYVVVGHNKEAVEEYFQGQNVHIVYNENFADGMFTSIRKGIGAISENGHDCALMTPVDIPLIPPYIFSALLNRYYNSDQTELAVACCGGKKAHPLLIPASIMQEVLSSDGENGMKSVTAPHESTMIRMDTHCQSILYDMDTPEAYRELLEFYRKHKYPDEEQCWRILDRFGTPAHIIKHCMAVTDTALLIAEELNKTDMILSIPLIRASGMLHDVLRVKPKHAYLGADLMLAYGYPEVADIIHDHMDYQQPLPLYDIEEKDIICLADKFCQEDRLVTLEQRLMPVLMRYKNDPEAVASIESKIGSTYAVLNYINLKLETSVYKLLLIHNEKARAAAEVPLRRVFLIRHGETKKHDEKIFLGQTDVPLSDEGMEQCRVAGIQLTRFKLNTKNLYCSNLTRAVQSAEIIIPNAEIDVTIRKETAFREMALGGWDGRPMKEIRKLHPEEFEERGKNLLAYRIDEKAENFYDLRARVVQRFHEIVQSEPGDIVIVAHSGVLRVLKCELTGRPLPDVLRLKIDRGSYELLDLTKEYAERHGLNIPVQGVSE